MQPAEFIEHVNCNERDAVMAALAAEPSLAKALVWAIGTTPLHCASHRGFREIVDALLQHGADVHARERASNTIPLHWAAEGGHPAIAQALVGKGSDLEAVDDWYGLTPLGWASVVVWAPPYHEDRAATVGYLLGVGAKVGIFVAIVLDQLDTVKTLVAQDRSVLSQRMGFVAAGMQVLHLAISRQKTSAVAQLLDLGADIESRTGSGVTPLGIAISRGDSTTAQLLRNRGAKDDVSSALISGDIAALAGHLGGLADADLLTKLLFLAARTGRSAAVTLLVQHGANPNARSKQLVGELPAEATPLHVAAVAGNDAVRALLDAGANPNPDPDGGVTSPMHLAAGDGHVDAVKALLQRGADKSARDKTFHATPQGWAEFGGHGAAAEALK